MNRDVEALVALKLTVLQAKIYLALATMGEAKMSTISKEVQVARQDIYRVASELQKMGMVEKIIANPIRYKALPVLDAVPILLKRVHEESAESHKKAMQLIERYKKNHKSPEPLREEHRFVLIPENEATSRRLIQSNKNAQKNIDIICSWKASKQYFFNASENYRNALKRGVCIRWLTNEPLDQETMPKIVQELLVNPLFELGFVQRIPDQKIGIFDNFEVYIATDPESGYLESPSLWSNAPPLIKLAKNYFDDLWESAKPSSMS